MLRYTLLTAALITTSSVFAQGSPDDSRAEALTAADKTFIQEAVSSGETEVALGKMASERATDPAVKRFAQKLANDHSNTDKQLQDLAKKKGVALPAADAVSGSYGPAS